MYDNGISCHVFVLSRTQSPRRWLSSLFAVCCSDNFQDQMKRELSYREEMVQQLHIVRGETNTGRKGEWEGGQDAGALRRALTCMDLKIFLSHVCRRDWWWCPNVRVCVCVCTCDQWKVECAKCLKFASFCRKCARETWNVIVSSPS